MKLDAKSTIETGKAILGIELGSTRIKAVLIDRENRPIAQGSHTWENQLVDGLWTYSIEAIWSGLQDCYADLRSNVKKLYDGIEIESLAAIGVSAMMHGYMPFNEKEEILVPFRTWRNTNTGRAAAELSELFVYNIPLRWSISHLYQAILNNETHVKDIKFLTTLAGYVHWQITGEKVLGIGDASGMLPIDPATNNYSTEMVEKFDNLIAPKEYNWKLENILPKVLSAGENAGVLTPEGSRKLDVSGHLKAGIPVCPPEGDAGTGISFRRTDRYSCLQMTGYVELSAAFRCKDTGVFACRQYFGQNILKFPVIFFRSNQIVELLHHFSRIVVGSRVYGEHSRCISYAQYFFTCYLPMYITCKGCQEFDIFDMRFVVQDSLVQVGNAPPQRDVIDK